MIRRSSLAAACGAVAALGLSACSATGGDTAGGSSGAVAAEEQASGDGGASPADTDLTWEDSPLAKLNPAFGYFQDTSAEADAAAAQQAQRVQELVAVCMAEQGFEFVPEQIPATGSTHLGDDLTAQEFAATYGYGLTTDGTAFWEPFFDPNAEILTQMTEAEREAWYLALQGSNVAEVVDGEVVAPDWTTSGCYGAAQHEVYEDYGSEALNALWSDPATIELKEAMRGTFATAMAGPEMTEVNREWSDCMADAGYPNLTEPDAAMMQVIRAAEAASPPAASGEGFDPPEAEVLARLRSEEIETAVADRACQDGLGYENAMIAIQYDYEAQFIEDYQADIDALLAVLADAAAAGGGDS